MTKEQKAAKRVYLREWRTNNPNKIASYVAARKAKPGYLTAAAKRSKERHHSHKEELAYWAQTRHRCSAVDLQKVSDYVASIAR